MVGQWPLLSQTIRGIDLLLSLAAGATSFMPLDRLLCSRDSWLRAVGGEI
jgi:hypothetical protein